MFSGLQSQNITVIEDLVGKEEGVAKVEIIAMEGMKVVARVHIDIAEEKDDIVAVETMVETLNPVDIVEGAEPHALDLEVGHPECQLTEIDQISKNLHMMAVNMATALHILLLNV